MLQGQIENACFYGRFDELKTLCRMANEDTRFFYLEEFCNPHLSKYHLMCANYIISCEKTEFINEKYRRAYIALRNWALRDYIMAFRITKCLTKWVKMHKKRNLRVAHILKFGY